MVTEVARRILQDNGHVDGNIISTERRGADDRSSVRSVEGEGREKVFEDTAAVNHYTDWYEVDLRERITVTFTSGGSAQARSFVSCAVVVTEPCNCDDGISPVTSPVFCENTATRSADNNEGSAVCTNMSRDKEDARPINNSASPSPNVMSALASDDMVLTRSRINQLQERNVPGEAEQQEKPDQESPTSREVVMDITQPDPRDLPQKYGRITYVSPLSFD